MTQTKTKYQTVLFSGYDTSTMVEGQAYRTRVKVFSYPYLDDWVQINVVMPIPSKKQARRIAREYVQANEDKFEEYRRKYFGYDYTIDGVVYLENGKLKCALHRWTDVASLSW